MSAPVSPVTEDYIHQISPAESRHIERFLRLAGLATALFVLLVGVAMATANRWLVFVSLESERRFMVPYVEFASKHFTVRAEAAPESRAFTDRLVKNLAATLSLPEGFSLEVHLLDTSASNAFATLGGHIFVTRGLLNSLATENSLAMVLAHEIAHITNRDPITGAGRALLFNLLFYLATGQSSAESVSRIGAEVALNTFSRSQEKAADLEALRTLHRAYGHAAGATTFFEQYRDLIAKGGEGDETGKLGDYPELIASHPDLNSRIDSIKAEIARNHWRTGEAIPYPEALARELTEAFRQP